MLGAPPTSRGDSRSALRQKVGTRRSAFAPTRAGALTWLAQLNCQRAVDPDLHREPNFGAGPALPTPVLCEEISLAEQLKNIPNPFPIVKGFLARNMGWGAKTGDRDRQGVH